MTAGRTRAVSLLGVVMLAAPLVVTPSAQAAGRPTVAVPLGPGADFTLLSRVATGDTLEVRTDGPTEIEFSRVSVAPTGTTGLAVAPGTVVVTVNQGVATAMSAEAGRCASRTVSAGNAFIQPPGSVGEIRNEGSDALEIYVISLTPTGPTAAPTPESPGQTRCAPGGV